MSSHSTAISSTGPAQMINVPGGLILKSVVGAAGLGSVMMALLDGATTLNQSVINVITLLATPLLTFAAVMAKIRYDKWQLSRTEIRTDAQSSLEREKLVDARFASLIQVMEEFHSEQIKSLQTQLVLSKELYSQVQAIVTQQRELIASQASTIQQLQATPPPTTAR